MKTNNMNSKLSIRKTRAKRELNKSKERVFNEVSF